MDLVRDKTYINWLGEIKARVRAAQIKAALAANKELIHFYFELGKMIVEQQEHANWGDKLINQLSLDLSTEFPAIKGFSATNLKYCKRFYTFYTGEISQQPDDQSALTLIGQQAVDQLPWGHNILIFTKSANLSEARFYIHETLQNNWSRDVLALQIKLGLYQRQGKAVTNFSATLPEPNSNLAQQTIKDPYLFDFVTFTSKYNERDIENQLVNHISKFLLELGKGFAFIGKQYHLEVADNDYYLDLLFYHTRLKCYVVIELKNTRFIPEYAGKLNFYLSAVDSLVKQNDDNPTIGILLCRDKNNIEAEFALRDINKPMGVSEFQITEILPDNLKAVMPTIEELEQGLKLSDHQ